MPAMELILIEAILYGITMKIADLLNEHGLKWFRGSAVAFGVMWGLSGALLILGNNTVANIILAMNIAFIIRNRLDFINHRIAASIIIIAFLFSASFEPWVFTAFLLIFAVFGSIKDYADDVLRMKGMLFALNEAMLYYPVPALVYCMLYGNWIVFWVFLLYTVSYDATKLIAARKGYR
jgi:hypothetical protein